MSHESYRRMLFGEISSRQYAEELKQEVRATRLSYLKHHRLSAYDRESVALAVIAAVSLAGIALCWWLG